MKLRPVKYKFTDKWEKMNPDVTDGWDYSFIAQELQQVFPESVTESDVILESDKSSVVLNINPQTATMYLFRGVHELAEENKDLKEKVAALENAVVENNNLKQKMASLNKEFISIKTKANKMDKLEAQIKELQEIIGAQAKK